MLVGIARVARGDFCARSARFFTVLDFQTHAFSMEFDTHVLHIGALMGIVTLSWYAVTHIHTARTVKLYSHTPHLMLASCSRSIHDRCSFGRTRPMLTLGMVLLHEGAIFGPVGVAC